MRFWINIEDATHAIVGAGPISNVIRCTVKWRLSQVGEITFEMPATDERASLVQARRSCSIWGMLDGVQTYLGGGVIDEITTRIGADGIAYLSVRGGDLLRELQRRSVGDLDLQDSDPAVNLAALFALLLEDPINWDASEISYASPVFQVRFVYESFLGSVISLAAKTGAYFRYGPLTPGDPPRDFHWFYTLTSSGVLATMHGDPVAIESNANACLITNIEVLEDSNDLKTRAYLFGHGEGASVMTAVRATVWPSTAVVAGDYTLDGNAYRFNRAENYISNLTAEAAYGRDDVVLAFKDIAPFSNHDADVIIAANFLLTAALEYLHKNRMPYKAYKLSVAGLTTLVKPGETILVQARRYRDGQKVIDINDTLYILEVESAIDVSGIYTSNLTVANIPRWPATGGDLIASEIAKTTVTSAHPQTGPNVDTIPYREPLDDSKNAVLNFWLAEETNSVQSVIVRFRVDPLRSTVKASALAVTTSGGGSLHTHGIPNHQHATTVAGLGAPVTPNIQLDLPGGGVGFLQSSNGSDVTLNTNVASGATTAVSESTHTHTITPTVTNTYGIFEESGGNTYAATDLEWKTAADVGYTSVGGGDAIAGAAGWYQVDITSRITDTNSPFRPLQPSNNIEFRIKVASHATKTAQLTVQIERRTTIQSIAVY